MTQLPQQLNEIFDWFQQIINTRYNERLASENIKFRSIELTPVYIQIDATESGESIEYMFAHLLQQNEPDQEELFVILLAAAPFILPTIFNILVKTRRTQSYPEFGGIEGKQHQGFLPTLETAIYLLAGNDVNLRVQLTEKLFGKESKLIKNNIITLQPVPKNEPFLSGQLMLSQEWLSRLTTGRSFEPAYTPDFPAKQITTKYMWEDLILPEKTLANIREMESWVKHQQTIMEEWGLDRHIKKGYRSIFHGPSGTGKTLTATLLGKSLDKPVYRVDLSMIVSKYIGETAKNLENVFAQAEQQDWILFFDEADALFGKRTTVSNSNDRHSNQEIAYLLQRIEDYDGIVILATNQYYDMDAAFVRRFQSIIHFEEPKAEERIRLWDRVFTSDKFSVSPEVDFEKLALERPLTGGMIVNVLRYCCLKILERGTTVIEEADIIAGLKREYDKKHITWHEQPRVKYRPLRKVKDEFATS
ncbi:MAG: ATP-binding protein [Flammeovirgaceae bacterium]